MLATSVLVRPWRALSSPRSVGRVTSSCPSLSSTLIRCGTCCVSSPSGPFTITRPEEIETLTPPGTSIGLLPIRLTVLLPFPGEKSSDPSPNKTDHFAADAELLRRPARDEAARGGHDRGPHAAKHARQAILLRVDAAAR